MSHRHCIGKLQKEAKFYAKSLMQQYGNPDCAQKIENWRTRITHNHDVHKIMQDGDDYQRAKKIVEYAKEYIILPMINTYTFNTSV